MRKINKLIIHHSASFQEWQSLTDSVKMISRWHYKRLHFYPNKNGNYVAYHHIITQTWEIWNPRPIEEVGYHCWVWYHNIVSVGICLLGNFEHEKPTKEQLESLQRLIRLIRKWQGKHLPIYWHKDFKNTKCPWKNLYSKIKNIN